MASGIEVVGHTGLTPQTSADFKQVGRAARDARRVREEAEGITAAGAYLLVLEHIPDALAQTVTRAVAIPTIGIGAGAGCDGQVLVINDAIGLGERWPPFSPQYVHAAELIVEAAQRFVEQMQTRTY